ncbi:MAG: tetratricopeptide repeat protein, partial [Dehalococcoidia bacterium]|nr:tetratricopeptide repeat protein [Dehalococcoidia bacterium]
MTRAAWRFALIAPLLLLAASVLASPWRSALAAPPSQENGPTQTPSSPDLQAAAEFALQGKTDDAIDAYKRVVESGTPDERLAARFGLAQLFLADGQPAKAVDQLDAYLIEAPEQADVLGAQYLLGHALALQGDWEGALPLYDAYVRARGPVVLYAELERAWVLANFGRGPEAAAETQRLLALDLPGSVRAGFLQIMARALEESQPDAALALYDRLRTESDSPAEQALVLWRSALIRSGLGTPQPLLEAWSTVIQRYPETATAVEIVEQPPGGIFPVDSYYTGLVYLRAGLDQRARQAFEASVALNRANDPLLAANAAYYVGSLRDRAGERDGAIDAYGEVLELDPAVEFADDAVWWRGRLLEEAGRIDEAAASYERLLAEYAGSDLAPEARFRLAVLDYDAGRYDEAQRAFGVLSETAAGDDRLRATLWQGKAL